MALKYYRNYRSGSGKTLKSIQVSLASRLEKFNLDSLAALTGADEMHLETVGQEKTALFAILPDNDSSFNFLVSILYTQLFQQLFAQADAQSSGELPLPVHLLMDEFANVSLPTDFDKILSVMRSRGIYVSILLQNLAQLKKLYEKEWESILGNCDELVYLGGNEPSTHKFLSEALGRETIDLENRDVSGGTSKSVSKHHQVLGRDLLTPDEIRKLPNEKSLILVRGERPILDDKYRIESHPNYKIIQEKEERGSYLPHRFRPDKVTVCTDEGLWEESGIPTLEAFVRSREMRYQ